MQFAIDMQIRQLFDRETSTYSYLVIDAGEAALIDPVREQIDRDLRLVRELGVRLTHVLDTHVHADHVTGAGMIRERTGATTAASAAGAPCVDLHLVDGSTIRIGHIEITALATPGHTDDSLSFMIPGAVFTGDALFVRGCGRTDFQNGNAGQLYDSITRVLFALPDDTVVYPAHDYNGHTMTTIGEERRFNPRVTGKTRDEFVQVMNALRLPPPGKLAVSVPANRACGKEG